MLKNNNCNSYKMYVWPYFIDIKILYVCYKYNELFTNIIVKVLKINAILFFPFLSHFKLFHCILIILKKYYKR